jgi:hypothetical protein
MAAEAGETEKISAPSAASMTAHDRLILADDPCRAPLLQLARTRRPSPPPNDLNIRIPPYFFTEYRRGPRAPWNLPGAGLYRTWRPPLQLFGHWDPDRAGLGATATLGELEIEQLVASRGGEI